MSTQDATCARATMPRRQKSSKPSIYFRVDSKGRRVYEYVYRDVNGRQRWVGGFRSLVEADDARGEVMRRIRRGERIAPVKVSFVEFAEQWLASQTQLRPATRARYEWALRRHIAPRFGKLKLTEITEDHVAGVIADMQRDGYRAATIKAVLGPMSLVFGRAVRKGSAAVNPVAGLERSERPRGDRRPMRILTRDEIATLIESTESRHRVLISTLVFAGLRISEALGLTWADVDLDTGCLHVRGQLDHKRRKRADGKTASASRAVVLMPALGGLLREHRLASSFSAESDYVFASSIGTPMSRDNVRSRILAPAVARAGLNDGRPRLRVHDLRHTFASLLIAGGLPIAFVAGQLGHKSPKVTLDIYVHQFDEREHACRATGMLEQGFGNVLETAARDSARPAADRDSEESRRLRAITGGRG